MLQYTIATAQPQEVQIMMDWANQEGWNPGLHDATTFYQADPSGFFLGRLGDEVICTNSCVNYGNRYAFLGLYIVKPEYRGKGYGMEMTRHLLQYARDRITGLDGVLQNIHMYEKIGFQYYYENKRFEGKARSGERDPSIFDLTQLGRDKLFTYDATCFPAPRENFLNYWITQPGALALAYLEDNQLKGYGVRRPCVEGHKIGPLFADDPVIAHALCRALSEGITGEKIILDVPEINTPALDLAQSLGMSYVMGCARMYKGGVPSVDTSKIYSVTCFELG